MGEVYEAVEIASSRSVAVKLLTAGLEWNESAHRARVIPRDIKPGNIIVVPQSDGGLRAVLTDFGLANPVRAARNRAHPIGWSAGHARLGEPATCRTDVY